MAAVMAVAAQPSPITPPHHRHTPHVNTSRMQFTSPPSSSPSSSFSSHHPAPFSPFRTSAPSRPAVQLSPPSAASVHSAARALTGLRSPHRFEAPPDDDEADDVVGYREQRTSGGGGSDEDDDDGDGAEEKYDDEDDERDDGGGTRDGLVDLSALLLQLRVDKRRGSPQRQRAVSPARRAAALLSSHYSFSPSSSLLAYPTRPATASMAAASSPPSSLSLAPSPLESSIAFTLRDMQRQYAERAELAIDARLTALQAALQSALSPSSAAAPSASPLSPLSSLAALHASSRASIQSLASVWQQHHAGQQRDYKQRLEATLAAEERKRKAREDEESRLRQEMADAEAEAVRRKQAAEEERERQERDRQEQEARQKDEQDRKQQQQDEQKRAEEHKQRQQQQAAQPAAAAPAAGQQPSVLSPAQAELQSHKAALAEVRALAAAYNSPNKTKHKVLINRTITQISHTKQSVQSKSLALNTLLQQAKQSAIPQEYAWVVETVAAKLVGQGETRVALQLSSAYSFGAVVLHVCRHDSTLWSCFYALLCERCVFAIPTYLDRKRYASQSAHMTAMGWQQRTDEQGGAVWEDEQQYFERQEGYIALYAAVCQYTTPHSATSHIHTLPQAWLWLSRLCNQEPRSATASVLYAFLSTAAFALYRRYGQQMAKLLVYVRQEVLGRLERSAGEKTPARTASMARLQLWLNAELDVLKRAGQLTEPEGRQLPDGQSQSTQTLQVNDGDYRGE